MQHEAARVVAVAGRAAAAAAASAAATAATASASPAKEKALYILRYVGVCAQPCANCSQSNLLGLF